MPWVRLEVTSSGSSATLYQNGLGTYSGDSDLVAKANTGAVLAEWTASVSDHLDEIHYDKQVKITAPLVWPNFGFYLMIGLIPLVLCGLLSYNHPKSWFRLYLYILSGFLLAVSTIFTIIFILATALQNGDNFISTVLQSDEIDPKIGDLTAKVYPETGLYVTFLGCLLIIGTQVLVLNFMNRKQRRKFARYNP